MIRLSVGQTWLLVVGLALAGLVVWGVCDVAWDRWRERRRRAAQRARQLEAVRGDWRWEQ